MHNRTGALGAAMLALAVLTGAFGSHGLQKLTTDPTVLEPYKTAVQYLCWHGLAILILWAAGDRLTERGRKVVVTFFMAGIILFCGSLFFLTLAKIYQLSYTGIVFLTPIGGSLFVAGWLYLSYLLITKQRN
ncbi:MAG: DUF423 domain-containing protein [Sphingomonadales bacterium]|nr:DUF423 domain-containing protein [Sphingomonadales bacterium]